MERRVTVVVALFVGAVALLGTWLLLTTDPTVPRSDPRVQLDEVGEEEAAKAIARDPRELRLDPRLAGPGSREVLYGKPSAVDEHLRGRMRPMGPTKAPTGTFTLDGDGIADAMDTRRPQLEDCYSTALLHAPDLPGSMSLSLVVTPSTGGAWGQVTAVDAAGVEDADVFETCAEGALGSLRFTTTEPSTVTVPVDLGPQ